MLSVISAFATATVLSVGAYAWNVDPQSIDTSYTNAPDNTYYADILFPLEESDGIYTGFNENTGKAMNIGADSEIVRYCEAGFRSLTYHCAYTLVEYTDENGNEYGSDYYDGQRHIRFLLTDEYDFFRFEGRYEKIRIAYYDPDGNILAVTNEAEICNFMTKYIQTEQNALEICADGESLSVEISSGPPWWIVATVFLFVCTAAIVAVVAALVIVLVHFIKKRRKKSS